MSIDIFSDMSNSDVLAGALQAKADLEDAAINFHETEWHEACFAGVLCYAMEMHSRRITLKEIV